MIFRHLKYPGHGLAALTQLGEQLGRQELPGWD